MCEHMPLIIHFIPIVNIIELVQEWYHNKSTQTSCYISYYYCKFYGMVLFQLCSQLHFTFCFLRFLFFVRSLSTVSSALSFNSVSAVHYSADAILISWWIQGSLLCLMSSECTKISSHWEPNYTPHHHHHHQHTHPPPPPVSEHGDFTLLLCKACFSVWVWQTHGFLQGEVTEDTHKRWAFVFFLNLFIFKIQKISCCLRLHT